jgi:opacity protein-like surface antigen
MSRKLLLLAASVALLAGGASFAQAADILEPQVVDLPEPVMPVASPAKGGWYIRGDIGYSINKMGNVPFYTAGSTGVGSSTLEIMDIDKNWSVGGGVGYDTGNYLRMDLTADYFTKANVQGRSLASCTVATVTSACYTTDTASVSALSLMANAYVDLGKFNGFTPYVGAGIGGTHLKFSELNNACPAGATNCTPEVHPGGSQFRFTYAVMAGASYDVTDCVALDAGYRYRKIEGGKMFDRGTTAFSPGPGHDKGITSHDFRVGARYKFGGCGASHVPDYQPDYQPVYK